MKKKKAIKILRKALADCIGAEVEVAQSGDNGNYDPYDCDHIKSASIALNLTHEVSGGNVDNELEFDLHDDDVVTPQKIEHFLGSENVSKKALIKELSDVINDVYSASDYKKDILNHWSERDAE